MKRRLTLLVIGMALALNAQQRLRVYIEPMVGNLDGFIAAEIIKQHLPVRVTIDEHDADFVLVGAALKEEQHWWIGVADKDHNEGNIRLLAVKSKTMVWAGEAGDRSLFFSGWRRGGERKVAERLVQRLVKDVDFREYDDDREPSGFHLANPPAKR